MTLYDIITVLIGEFEKDSLGCISDYNWAVYKLFIDEFAQLHNMTITGRMQEPTGWSTLGATFNTPEDELVFKLRFGHCTDDFYKTQLRKI